MTLPGHRDVTRLERHIMDALYRLEEGAVADVLREVPETTSYDSVRVTLGKLEDRGLVQHRKEGRRYVYSPTVPREEAGASALQHLLKTFFEGSARAAVLALLRRSGDELDPDDLEEIRVWIEETDDEEEL